MRESEPEVPKAPYMFHGEEQPLNFIFDPKFIDSEPEPGERIGYVRGQTHMSSDIMPPEASLYWELDAQGRGMVVSRVDGKNDTPKEAHLKKKRKKERRSGRMRSSRRR